MAADVRYQVQALFGAHTHHHPTLFRLKIVSFLILISITLTLLLSSGVKVTESAVAHSHARSRHGISPTKEREEDGAYAPRGGFGRGEWDDKKRTEFDHEAIIGSTREAQEFDHLEEKQSKEKLLVLTKKMDLDSDGYITRTELKAWVLRSFRMLSEEEAEEGFEDADANGDGKISWPEFVEENYGLDIEDLDEVGGGMGLQDLEDEMMMKEDKLFFKAADVNGDGSLDLKEFLAFSHPEENPNMIPLIYNQTMTEKDTNRDGYIDFKEFAGEDAKDKDEKWLKAEKDKFDEDLDKNKDGLLDRQEIIDWAIPNNEDVATEEVTHLFAASDDDHDDRLSYEEILAHHDTFVGSEVTDYGDHLHNLDRFDDEL